MPAVSMSAVWDRTTEFLSDNVGAVVTIAALTLYLPGVIGSVLGPVQSAMQPGSAKFGLAVVAFAISLINLFGQLALTVLALEPATGARGAFGGAAARFSPTIAICVVLFLLALLLVMPPIVLLAAEGVNFEALTPGWTAALSPTTIWLVSLYTLILVPLFVWACARLSVVMAVVAAERRGLGAIRRTWALTKGSALRIAGAAILLVVVGGVAALAAETVFGSVFRIIFGNAGVVNPATVLTAVFVGLVSTALSVILTTFFAKLYVALKARAEAAVPA